MGIIKVDRKYILQCSHCNELLKNIDGKVNSFGTKEGLEDSAFGNGWEYCNGKHYCKNCALFLKINF